MAKSAMSGSDRLLMRVALVLLVLVLGWVVLGWVLSALYTLVRIAILLALLGVVAWFVLVGPPGKD